MKYHVYILAYMNAQLNFHCMSYAICYGYVMQYYNKKPELRSTETLCNYIPISWSSGASANIKASSAFIIIYMSLRHGALIFRPLMLGVDEMGRDARAVTE